MPRIRVVEPESPESELGVLYRTIAGARGAVANILRIHSLSPRTLAKHFHYYKELMFGRTGLSRAQRELIAVAVSQTNDCHY